MSLLNQTMAAQRFQLWRVTSQSGTYSIDEEHYHQVFEMTCTDTKVCKRVDTRKGGGPIPAPPGGKSVAGVSMVEVDSVNKDMAITLPVPLVPLAYTRTVTTTIPDEKGATTQELIAALMPRSAEMVTVSIPGNVVSMSGTKTIPVKGEGAEGGTITVNWQFARQ